MIHIILMLIKPFSDPSCPTDACAFIMFPQSLILFGLFTLICSAPSVYIDMLANILFNSWSKPKYT